MTNPVRPPAQSSQGSNGLSGYQGPARFWTCTHRHASHVCVALVALVAAACSAPARLRLDVTPETFATVLAEPWPDGTLLELGPGEYVLEPRPHALAVPGREEPVTVTVGLLVTTPGLVIRGAGAERTVLRTRADCGVLFQDVPDALLTGLTVTGGVRSPDPAVPAAGVTVAGTSDVRIRACRVTDNVGDPEALESTVSGIVGIDVRDRSRAWIRDNELYGNSWDGVAVRHRASALVDNNVVDGVWSGRGPVGGRGVGISVQDRATAVVTHNYVTRTWKGIGVFGDATASVMENVVESVRTWGLTVWGGERGAPRARVERNLVRDTGACGASVRVSAPAGEGALRGNLLWETGRDPAFDAPDQWCEQCAVAVHGLVDAFVVEDNVAWATREAGDAPGRDDVEEADFLRRLEQLRGRFAAWPALQRATSLEERVAPAAEAAPADGP